MNSGNSQSIVFFLQEDWDMRGDRVTGVKRSAFPFQIYFPAVVVRAVLATRLNSFLQGHSGVRRKLVDVLQAMLNRGVIPLVPFRGSVVASGDLCPLSHTFATLLGAGRFYIAGTTKLRVAS